MAIAGEGAMTGEQGRRSIEGGYISSKEEVDKGA